MAGDRSLAEADDDDPLDAHGATVSGAAPTLDASGLSRVFEQVGGDVALMRHLVELFLETAREDTDKLSAAAAKGDGDKMAFAAHRLRSSARNLAATHMAEICGKIEDLVRRGELAQAVELSAEVPTELGDVGPRLQRWADELEAGP